MKKYLIILSLVFALCLTAAETVQDTTKAKRKVYQLEGIRVVAQRPEQAIGNISLKTYNPDESVLDLDAAEALDNLSGLDLAVGGKSGSELSIRGFSEEQIKIMVDGRPLSNSYMDAVDLTSVPLTNVKEIQVLKGPISALYGSNTMGGVINIITQAPKDKMQLTLGSQLRRNNTNKFYADFSQNFDWFDYTISASRYHTDGFMLPQDFPVAVNEYGEVRDQNARTQYDLQTKFNFELWDFHKIGLQFGYTNQPLKEITANIYETNFRQFTNWERYQGSLSAFFQLRDNLEYNGQIYYDQYNDTYEQYDDADFTQIQSGFPSNLESWTFGSNNNLDWNLFKNLKITNGLRYEKNVYNRIDQQWYTEWTSNSTQQFNYFLQAEAKQGEISATLSSGLALFKAKNNPDWRNHFLPSAGVYYKNDRNLKLSLASGINTTYPTLRQLYSHTSGNENLKEEQAWKNEFTAQQAFAFRKFAGSVYGSFYYNQISNLIERIGDINQNLDTAKSYGFETKLNLKLGWEHQISYSYLKYTNDDIAKYIGAPENTISFRESYKIFQDFKLIYKAAWKDSRLTENSAVILDPYWTHDLNFQAKYKNYKLAIGIENIFDKYYFSKYGYPGPGRNFILNLEVNI